MLARFLELDVETQIAIVSFIAIAVPNALAWVVGLFSPKAADVIHGAIPSVRDTVSRGSDLYRSIRPPPAPPPLTLVEKKGGDDAPRT